MNRQTVEKYKKARTALESLYLESVLCPGERTEKASMSTVRKLSH